MYLYCIFDIDNNSRHANDQEVGSVWVKFKFISWFKFSRCMRIVVDINNFLRLEHNEIILFQQ